MEKIDWIDGATHYRPGVATFYKQADRAFEWSGGRWHLISNDLGEFLWSDQLIERPTSQPAAWNGEGLPPAGCKDEYLTYGGEWKPGTYVGQFNGQMVCGCDDSGVVGVLQSGELRPIRTPEQIAADEREAAIKKMAVITGFTLEGECKLAKLYDAGLRFKDGAQ
jgi:hypothetical protein